MPTPAQRVAAAYRASRPGPHWNPWPTRQTTTKDLIEGLETSARFSDNLGWSDATARLVNDIAQALRRNDEAKVRRLLPALVRAGEVSAGMVNEIQAWLDGFTR